MGFNVNSTFGFGGTGGGGGGGGTVNGANNGLSLSGTNAQLGQTVDQIGAPASLMDVREIPLNGFGITLSGDTTPNGQLVTAISEATILIGGDTSVGVYPILELSNIDPASGNHGIELVIGNGISALAFINNVNENGILKYDATGNLSIGDSAAADNTLAGIQASANLSIDTNLTGDGTTINLRIINNAAIAMNTPNILVTDQAGNEEARITMPGSIANDGGSVYIGGLAGAADTAPGQPQTSNSVGIGWKALQSQDGGNGNVAVGYYALNACLSGSDNMAVGGQSLQFLTTGRQNVAMGFNSGELYDGIRSVFVGHGAGSGTFGTSPSPDLNVMIGWTAGLSFNVFPITSSANTFVGAAVMRLAGYGNSNVVIGEGGLSDAGSAIGANNVLLGAGTSATNTPSNSTAIGHGIQINSSNVAVFGRDDQNIILGQTSSVDNGMRVQVNGNMSILTVNTAGANPTAALIWDTVTGEVLKATGAAFAGAINGLSQDISGNVVLGQDVGAAGDPAQLISSREIPMFDSDITLRGDVTANGTNLYVFSGSSAIFSVIGDSATTPPTIDIVDNNNGGGNSISMTVAPLTASLSFVTSSTGYGLQLFYATRNLAIGDTSLPDSGSAAIQLNANVAISTVNAIGSNAVRSLVWDTVTNEVLQGASSGSASNGLSVDSTSGDTVLGQDLGDPLAPAALSSFREIPIGNQSVLFTGPAGGFVTISDSAFSVYGDPTTTPPTITVTDVVGSVGSVIISVTPTIKYLLFQGSTTAVGIGEFRSTGNLILGDLAQPDNGSPLQVTSSMVIANSLGVAGIIVPAAYVHMGSGTSTAGTAPLKFSGGTNLGIPEQGAVEYNGTSFFATPVATRLRLVLTDNSIPANGMLPIGNGTNYTNATLTAGPGIGVANAAGAITIATKSSIRQLAVNGVVGATDQTIVVDTSGGNITITITPANVTGTVNIKKKGTDANTITLTMASGHIFADAGSQTSYTYSNAGQNAQIQSDGTDVYVV